MCGSNNCLPLILILACCGNGNGILGGSDCGCGNGLSSGLGSGNCGLLLLLLLCCGNGNLLGSDSCGCPAGFNGNCGCPCS